MSTIPLLPLSRKVRYLGYLVMSSRRYTVTRHTVSITSQKQRSTNKLNKVNCAHRMQPRPASWQTEKLKSKTDNIKHAKRYNKGWSRDPQITCPVTWSDSHNEITWSTKRDANANTMKCHVSTGKGIEKGWSRKTLVATNEVWQRFRQKEIIKWVTWN